MMPINRKNLHPIHIGCITEFPFIDETFDSITYYQILQKLGLKTNEIIRFINNVLEDKIVEYIKRFQTIEQTKKEPIVVPFSVWVKNAEDFNDTTASRLAFHWLDHIGYIKQRYL